MLPLRILSILGYLLPVVAIALVVRASASLPYVYSLLTLPGTITHELLHFLVGAVLGAKPVNFSLLPKKQGDQYVLGSVSFERLTWLNAIFVCLAPLLGVAAIGAIAWWRTADEWQFAEIDIAIWLLAGVNLLSAWPSSTDWRLALRSWPLLVGAGIVGGLWIQHP